MLWYVSESTFINAMSTAFPQQLFLWRNKKLFTVMLSYQEPCKLVKMQIYTAV